MTKSQPYTIIIPAFNAQDLIHRTLDSIAAQTVKPAEVLIGIDNCPATLAAVRSHPAVHFQSIPTSIYYFPSHAGCYRIRNTLAQLATSPTLLFFDADDEMHPHYADSMLSHHSIISPVITRAGMFIPSSKNFTTAISQICISRSNFLALGGFEPWGCSGDTELYQRAMQQGFTDIKISSPIMDYHIHNNNLTVAPKTGMRSPMRIACHREIERRQLSPVARQPNILATATAVKVSHLDDDIPPSTPAVPSIILLGLGVDEDLAVKYTDESIRHICGAGEVWTINDWWWRYPRLAPDRAIQIHVNLPDDPLPQYPDRWKNWQHIYRGFGDHVIIGAPDPRLPEATVHDMQFLNDIYGTELTTSSISCAMLIAMHHYSTKTIKLLGVPLSNNGEYRHQGEGLLKTCELCERNGITVIWPERDFVAADVESSPPTPARLTPYWLIGT